VLVLAMTLHLASRPCDDRGYLARVCRYFAGAELEGRKRGLCQYGPICGFLKWEGVSAADTACDIGMFGAVMSLLFSAGGRE